MSGLVVELQQAAMDSSVKVADVLRRALVVSKKLRLTPMERWIADELNGYGEGDVPDYRSLAVVLRELRPHGYAPMVIKDEEISELVSTFACGQALPQLEGLINESGHLLEIPFTSTQEDALMKLLRCPYYVTRFVSQTQMQGIVRAVRDRILAWSLDLESEGVIGEGMTFSAKEREAAHHVTHIVNHIGSMHHSQLQQASPGALQHQNNSGPIPELSAVVEALAQVSLSAFDAEDAAELRADIATLKAQAESPKPKTTMVQEGLKSVRNILERAAGSVITAEVLPMVTALLHHMGGR